MKKNIRSVYAEDLEGYHRRIYLVEAIDSSEIPSLYLIRIWGTSKEKLSLSEDFRCPMNPPETLALSIASMFQKFAMTL